MKYDVAPTLESEQPKYQNPYGDPPGWPPQGFKPIVGVDGRGESVLGGGEGDMTALLIIAVILLLVWFVFKKPLFVGIALVVIGYCYYNDVNLGGNLGTNSSV